MATLSLALAREALTAHDASLERSLNYLTRYKQLSHQSAEDIANTLCAENLCSLGKQMSSDPTARKRVNNYLAKMKLKVAPLVWEGKETRPCGRCYFNAYEEFLETGNPIAYGWIDGSTVINDYFVTLIPHAFNYDVKTGRFYDTTFYSGETHKTTKPVFVITDLLQAATQDDVTKNIPAKGLDKTIGGWHFITHGDKTYVFQGWGHSQKGSPRPCHYEALKLVDVLE